MYGLIALNFIIPFVMVCYGFCRIYLKEAPGKRYDIR